MTGHAVVLLNQAKVPTQIFPVELSPCVLVLIRLSSFSLLFVLEQLQDDAEVDARLLIVVVLRPVGSQNINWLWIKLVLGWDLLLPISCMNMR